MEIAILYKSKMETKYIDEEKYSKAQNEVDKLKAFYWHIVIYFSITTTIVFINLKLTPEVHWFWYAAVGGGISLIIHALKFFVFNNTWEEKTIVKILRDNENKKV